jgi:NADPH-ferrihemoprotein reductase
VEGWHVGGVCARDGRRGGPGRRLARLCRHPAYGRGPGEGLPRSVTPPYSAFSRLLIHPPRRSGELSARALTRSKGIHDAKNPFPSAIKVARELFQNTGDRNCVHVELDIEGSGITYQHGDHVGVWPSNADAEVTRLLCALGLYDKRDTVIGIESLDPALAKVPFPVPTTYDAVLRHYLDVSAVAGRQMLGALAKFAPSPAAEEFLRKLSSSKEEFAAVVTDGCLKLGELLQLVAGDDIKAVPESGNTTVWTIPFDIVVSSIPRLQPRYYSISSSPKLHPNAIHVTCVVLKYQSIGDRVPERSIYGVGSNFLLNLKYAASGEQPPVLSNTSSGTPAKVSAAPAYRIEGPRGAHREGTIYKVPVHVRRSTFRLPTNPKSPIIMIGPGTVRSAPC